MREPRFQRSGEVLAIKRKTQDALSELCTGKGKWSEDLLGTEGPLNEMILMVQEAGEGEGKLKEGRRTKQHSEANDTPQVSIPLVKKKSNIILILHPIVALEFSVIQWKLVRGGCIIPDVYNGLRVARLRAEGTAMSNELKRITPDDSSVQFPRFPQGYMHPILLQAAPQPSLSAVSHPPNPSRK
jgi:hypothetical protein